MTWIDEITEPLRDQDLDQAVDATAVVVACDAIDASLTDRRRRLSEALRESGHGALADGVSGKWRKKRDELANRYFACGVPSYRLALDDAREQAQVSKFVQAGSLLFVSTDLCVVDVVSGLRALPAATVLNADRSRYAPAFARVYRHTTLKQMAGALGRAWFDLEAMENAVAVGLGLGERTSFRSSKWPFDAEYFPALVARGYLPTGQSDLVNSVLPTSPVVAAGVVRSKLESILFLQDLKSILGNGPRIAATDWSAAAKEHADAGRLTATTRNWVTGAYGILSEVLHSGFSITWGEIELLNWTTTQIAAELRTAMGGPQLRPVVLRPRPGTEY